MLTPARLQRIRADQVEALFQGIAIGMVATLAAAGILAGFIIYQGQSSIQALSL